MVVLSDTIEIAVENEHESHVFGAFCFVLLICLINIFVGFFTMTKAVLKEKLHFHLLIGSLKNRMASNHMKYNVL